MMAACRTSIHLCCARLLEHGLVPLVQGDVALDTVRGATIVSTEDVFIYLVREFQPSHILLAGEVAGVFENADMTGAIIPVVTPGNVRHYAARRWVARTAPM